ncbi:hypothetical protein ACWEJS_26975, partial [Rhodococcus triatomae]
MSGDTGGGRPGPRESVKRQRPLKRARVGWPPVLRELKELLYEVYLAAGAPSLDEIAGDIVGDDLAGAPRRDTVHRIMTDGERPGQQADVVAVATVLARRAAWDIPDLAGRVRELWVQAGMAQRAGRPIGDLRDDIRLVLDGGLGVHPALDAGGGRDRFGILPAYIQRDHDARLKAVVEAAEAGRSGIAVLVGGSSTGKTRALWEAVCALPEGWRLWHPLSPTAPDAVLAALPDIAPRTVVWLNEAQHYLDVGTLGEQVAAGLREQLHDPSRAPVLVLGTLWPQHWDALTIRSTSDRHANARALLSGHKIDVPDAFTPADLAALDTSDPRLAQAAQHAKGAQITQYLAGVPYLMDRYNAARGATLALIHAAMDARRLGAGLHLSLDWLADAALSYLDEDEYHTLDRDWLIQALAYVTAPCNGISGILTPVTTTGPRNRRIRRRPPARGTSADRTARSMQGPHYLLADYLDQHGRQHRADIIPPIDFWTSASHHARPTDLTALGNAAWDRGLYRDAAQLHKHATAHGNPHAAIALVRHLQTLHPADHQPAQWAATYAADNPNATAALLWMLRRAGAKEQVTVLAERATAHALLEFPGAVARLLEALQEAEAKKQVAALLARDPATHAALDDPHTVIRLLWMLRQAGAEEQVTVLAGRATAHVALKSPGAVARLLEALRQAEAEEQVNALLARDPATHATLDNPNAVARLLEAMRHAEAEEQVSALLARDPATHATLDNPDHVASLLRALRQAGAEEQVNALAKRATAHVDLEDTHTVARLLEAMRQTGAEEQVNALLARDPATHATLDNPAPVASLLRAMRRAGAEEQVAALLARDPATHATLDNPTSIEMLYEALRETRVEQQVNALGKRATAHIDLDDPNAVIWLLEALRRAGAEEQVNALAERATAHNY